MKKIKIFLASSITEFAEERNALELFIRNVSDEFEEKYDTKINVRTAMTEYRKEENITNIPLYMIGNIEKILLD